MRNNPVFWRMAEWLYVNCFDFVYPGTERFYVSWCHETEHTQNHFYDKAAVLYAKVLNNEFTGSDNHSD